MPGNSSDGMQRYVDVVYGMYSCAIRPSRIPGRRALKPRLRSCQLPGQSKQRRVAAELGDELHPNRQSVAIPLQWHRHRWLSSGVEQRRKRNAIERLVSDRAKNTERMQQPAGVESIDDAQEATLTGRRLERADHRRRCCQSGCQQHVVLIEKGRQRPCRKLQRAEDIHISGDLDGTTDMGKSPGYRLKLTSVKRVPG